MVPCRRPRRQRRPGSGIVRRPTTARRRAGRTRASPAQHPRIPGGAMDHEPVLITTIAIGLTAAFIGAFIARRLHLPAIVGYIAAGVAIGPFTPGFVADQDIATELAELGVILLMFGVGIHFSIRDLLAVKSIAIPGAIGQILVGHAPRRRARGRPGLGPRRRARARPRRVGGEHRRPAASADGPRRPGHGAGPHRRRLAHRRGPVHGRRARAPADHRPAARRHGRRPRGDARSARSASSPSPSARRPSSPR